MPGVSVTPALTTCRSLRRNSAVWTSPSSVFSGLPMAAPTAFQSIGEPAEPAGAAGAAQPPASSTPNAIPTPALARRLRRGQDRTGLTVDRDLMGVDGPARWPALVGSDGGVMVGSPPGREFEVGSAAAAVRPGRGPTRPAQRAPRAVAG